MAYFIGFSGKGGTGKTTLAGMLIRYLVENKVSPVLAVDADANFNLNDLLGLKVNATLADAREEMKKVVEPGMTKDVFMALKLEQAVMEASGFDLLVMGRPEGPGCYCVANTLLSRYLDKLIHNYSHIVMDNEAGMEHISRLSFSRLDLLMVVSDASQRGIQAAARIFGLADELGLEIKKKAFIINRVVADQAHDLIKISKRAGLDLTGLIPEDPGILENDLQGRSVFLLGAESKALGAAYEIFGHLIKS